MYPKDGVCVHLEELKVADLETFSVLHRVFVVSSEKESKYAKLKNGFCHVCSRRGPYLHACINCVFFGCLKHIRDHTRISRHDFTLELSYGQVYCRRCGDYVYDNLLDFIAAKNTMDSDKCNNKLMYWNASTLAGEFNSMHLRPKRICITPESTYGLRGLYNLGETCFVSCIVQVLMHTPILRDYCFSERHKCKETSIRCILCELLRVYQDFYKGQRMPFSLHNLQHMLSINLKQLFNNIQTQQDVHEFYVVMMDILHQNCMNSLSPVHSISNDITNECPCIFDRIFKGQLQSDLVCERCNGISTKLDPMWDFVLDIGSSESLTQCLGNYIQPEYLGMICKCSSCNSLQNATKQVTVKRLPLVVVFCLKRFRTYLNKNNDVVRKKISSKITFPEVLDMSPYMTATPESDYKVMPSDHRYSLYAVVNHLGEVDGGHYIVYIRQQRDYWYLCYDHNVTKASLEDVLNSEGYLLFYHKQILSYD